RDLYYSEKSIVSFVQPIMVLGQYFHSKHLRCNQCRKSVDSPAAGLKERKEKDYCEPDYNTLFLPKCQSCRKAVEIQAVTSVDGKLKGNWHKYCLKCRVRCI
ncbi:hypothetical protein BD408DRAFT_350510, partial [Parasitella parasitica]